MKTRAFALVCGAVLLWLGAATPSYASDNAAFVSQSVPTAMLPGQTYAVSVTMQNTGTTTWSVGNAISLGSHNPQNNTTWGTNRVILPTGVTVAPGTAYTFSYNVTAPTTPGTYNFRWQMVHDGVAWFGALSTNVAVIVGPGDNSQFVSQSVPSSMVANQSYSVTVTMKNIGVNTWTPGDYYLGSQNPQDNTNWSTNRIELPTTVATNESVTFAFNVTPQIGGIRNFQWRMAKSGTPFGVSSTNVAVSVSGTDNAAFVSQNVPAAMIQGQTYSMSVTMQNTGNTTWSVGNAISLGSHNPQNNTTWGTNRVILPTGVTVAPGTAYTFSYNVTAPTTPGTYNFRWQMVHDGVAWFGALSTNLQVTVNANTAPTVGITSPANGVVFAAPANIPLTAAAADSDGTIANVEFYQGATLLATLTSSPFTFNWTNVVPGNYTLTAKATDNQGATTTSAPVTITVSVAGASTFYYIHTDHLNTPRVITNQAQQVVWRWDNTDPFGGNAPEENPSGLGNFTCNLRLPGQYFDRETNLHYNYFRDYDPGIGRYIASDPIGLEGGLNLYQYASSNPISNTDPTGETTIAAGAAVGSAFGPVGTIVGAGVGLVAGIVIANAISNSSSSSSSAASGSSCPPNDDKKECEELLKIDTATCNGVTRRRGAQAGAICHASASQRYAECRRWGLPGVRTPLAVWNN